MTKVRGVTGGGILSNKVSHVNAPKQEPKPHAVSVGAVSRLGAKIGPGTPFKSFYNQQAYTNPVGPTDSMGQGPGANRTVMRSGSQASTPAARPMPHGRKTF
jgi:hypothetical protein